MPYRQLLAALALAGASLAFPQQLQGQGLTASEAAALHRLHPGKPESFSPAVAPNRLSLAVPDSAKARGTDYTLPGLLIGAGLGFAGGWAFYDLLCEAVDNQCADSRFRLVIPATAVGGTLGALIGSLAE